MYIMVFVCKYSNIIYDICRLMKILAVLAQPLKTYRLCPQQRSAAWCLCEAAGRMLVRAVGLAVQNMQSFLCNKSLLKSCCLHTICNIQYTVYKIYVVWYTCLNNGGETFFQYEDG